MTHIDALVLTRSAFHHSAIYRSVVILGRPDEVTDATEKSARLRAFKEQLMPGRWDALRPVKPKELKATRLLRLATDEASAKVHDYGPADEKADLAWPAWGGLIPIAMPTGAPQPDDVARAAGLAAPAPRKPARAASA